MAATYGSSSYDLSVGIDVSQSPSSVGSGTSSVTLTVTYYVRVVGRGYSDNQTLTLSGSLTGSYNYSMSAPYGGNATVKVATRTLTVPTSVAGTVSRSFSAKVSGSHNGASPSHSRSATVARRPYSTPATPTNAKATRASDTSHTLAWTNKSTTTAPYTTIEIRVWTQTRNDYVNLATIPINTTYKATTKANERYRYAIRGVNSAGASGWAYTGYLSNTPGTPTSVKAVRSGNDIDISFARNCLYGTSFEIWHASNGSWDTTPLANVTKTSTKFTHVDPPLGVSHTYRVRYFETDGNIYSSYSGTTSAITIRTNPDTPKNVVATRISDTSQKLTWTNINPTDVTKPYSTIYIHRWDHIGDTYVQVAVINTATTWTDITTKANTRYRYRIYVKNVEGNSGYTYSNYIPTTPAAPTLAKSLRDVDDIEVTWSVNSTYGSGIRVYHAADGAWDSGPIVTLSPTSASWTHLKPEPGVTHTYRIAHYESVGNLQSAYSNTSNGSMVQYAPKTPTGVVATFLSDTSQRLTWTSVDANNPANPYTNVLIYRWDNTSLAYSLIATLGNVSTWTDGTTKVNARYMYRVYARNAQGTTPYASSPYRPTTPATPTSFSSERAGLDIDLSWNVVATYGTGVQIYHAVNGTWDVNPLASLGMGVTSYTHSNPTPGAVHTYRARHYDQPANIYSAYTATTPGVSPQSDPKAPTDLVTTRISDTSHKLTWKNTDPTNPLNPYTGIVIQRQNVITGVWGTVATLGVVSTWTDTTTLANNRYRYRLYAKNNIGDTANLYGTTFSTTPAAPTSVVAVRDGVSIDISWVRNCAYGSRFEVWHAANGVWDTTALAILTLDSLSYTHANPTLGVAHTYRVRHYEVAGPLWSAYSSTTSAITIRAIPKPPTSLVAARVSDTSQKLTWVNTDAANPANPYTNVKVERWESIANVWTTLATLGNVTTYSDVTTVANKYYRYRISASNVEGSTTLLYSNFIATTPGTPTAVTAVRDGSTIDLKWTRNTTYGSAVEVWHAANGVWDTTALVSLSVAATSFTDDSPALGVAHTYRIRYYESAGPVWSAYSAIPSAITITAIPKLPTNPLVTRISDTSQKLTWTNTDASNPANPYLNIRIERWNADTKVYALVATLGAVSTWTDTTTLTNSDYRYRFYVSNAEGNTSWVYTDYIATTPAAPSSVVAERSDEDIYLTFTPESTIGSGIEIWHAMDGVMDANYLTSQPISATEWTHVRPKMGVRHTYHLRHRITAGHSHSKVLLHSPYSPSTTPILPNGLRILDNLPPNVMAGSNRVLRAYYGTKLVWEP